jgi:hypothetical protein
MSGKRITDEQVKFYMSSRKQPSHAGAGECQAGISERSARRIEHGEVGVSAHRERHWRTRSDPFAGVWEEEIVSRLEQQPRLDATTLFEDLQDRHPGEYGNGQEAHLPASGEGLEGAARRGQGGDLPPGAGAGSAGVYRISPNSKAWS